MKCVRYEKKCNSEIINVCKKKIFIDDVLKCEIQGFKCEIEDIKDRNCEDECARRQREFDIDYNVLNALYEAIEIFEKRNLNVMEIINYGVNNPTSFIDVLDAHFDEEMGGVIKEKSISVSMKISYFGKEIDEFSIKYYDF